MSEPIRDNSDLRVPLMPEEEMEAILEMMQNASREPRERKFVNPEGEVVGTTFDSVMLMTGMVVTFRDNERSWRIIEFGSGPPFVVHVVDAGPADRLS